MGASKAEILYALENSMFEFRELPGQWETPTFTGLRAHATPHISHIFGNMVGVSTLTIENADAVIAQVKDFFGKRQQDVGWWLNPSSTPIDLVNRLEAADAVEELIHVLHAAPFAVADDVNAGHLLEADGEPDKVVHGCGKLFGG